MPGQIVEDLVHAGIHFGHRASRWNPKMKPYIFGKRNLIHIIDVKQTLRGILLAKKFLRRVVSQNRDVLFVGTKHQARKALEELVPEVQMHYITERWLGGTLTNFREIRKRVARMEELETMQAEGTMDAYSKKEGASLRRELHKIQRNLNGIRGMDKLPAAMFVIDQQREIIACREARKLHIPIIALMDTDSDPDLVDIPIPGNDDAMRAIDLVVREMCEAIREGVGSRQEGSDTPEQQPRRRSRRTTTARAEDEAAAPAAEAETPEPAAEAAPPAPAPAPAEPPLPAPDDASAGQTGA